MGKIKNICFAYITPFHPERGGIGRVTHTLTMELQRRGYNVFYLIYPCAITIRHEYDYPAPLEYLPSSDCLSQENIDYYFDYLKRNKIDVVINQSGNFSDSALWLKARERGVKVVSVLHSAPWVSYKHLWHSDILPLKNDSIIEKFKRIARICLYPKIKRRVRNSRIRQFQTLLPQTNVVTMLSKGFYQELSSICYGYEEKYEAIPNPNTYDCVQLDDGEVAKKQQLLFVGLFGPPKNDPMLVKLWSDICRDYSDWELVMVGDGHPDRVKRLKHLSKDISNIRFTGFQDPLPYYKTASIFCMMSIYEGWGMVLTEAMQCGTVPIAFNSFASASDIIDDGRTGMLVAPFDIKEYKRKLCRLMDDENLRQQMSINARESVKRFDVGNVVDQWEQLFERI